MAFSWEKRHSTFEVLLYTNWRTAIVRPIPKLRVSVRRFCARLVRTGLRTFSRRPEVRLECRALFKLTIGNLPPPIRRAQLRAARFGFKLLHLRLGLAQPPPLFPLLFRKHVAHPQADSRIASRRGSHPPPKTGQSIRPNPMGATARLQSPSRYNETGHRGVAQPGSASALGAEGRGFESLRPDQFSYLSAVPLPLNLRYRDGRVAFDGDRPIQFSFWFLLQKWLPNSRPGWRRPEYNRTVSKFETESSAKSFF